MNKRIMTLVAGLAWAARSVIAPYRNGQDARCPSCGRDARHPDKRGHPATGGRPLSKLSEQRAHGGVDAVYVHDLLLRDGCFL